MAAVSIITSGQVADLPPASSGFGHGFGLFETLRLGGGRVYFWDRHWARLERSASAFGLPLPTGAEAAFEALCRLVDADGLENASLKLSLLKTGPQETRLFVYARPLASAPVPLHLGLERDYPINERSLLSGHKSHNYMENMALLERARERGFYDCLRCDTRGFLAEGTIANVYVDDGTGWVTPPLGCGVLPGVIREILLETGRVVEAAILPERLGAAGAIGLSNASIGLLNVDCLLDEVGNQLFRADPASRERLKDLANLVEAIGSREARSAKG